MPLCYQQQMLQARPGFVIPVTSAGTHAGGQHPANTCYLFQHHQHSPFTICFYNCTAYSHGRVSTSSRTGLLFDRLSPVMGTSRGSVPIPLRCSHWPSDSSCPCRVPPDISPSFLLFPLPPTSPSGESISIGSQRGLLLFPSNHRTHRSFPTGSDSVRLLGADRE